MFKLGVAHTAKGVAHIAFRVINFNGIKMSKNKLLDVINPNLALNNSQTVHPNILLRTPLFTPIAKNGNKADSKGRKVENEVTDELREIRIFQREGYDFASILGRPLNVRTDFRVWCGVILAFSKYGYDTDTIEMKLSEFVKFCGFSTRVINKVFRVRIQESLLRISDQKVCFKTSDRQKMMTTSLLQKFVYDETKDVISLEADPELWELYSIDHQIIVSMRTISVIPRAETAQCLYLYFASLPENPIPVTLSRMRERLRLNMPNKEANRAIKTAIAKLESIGYLKGREMLFNDEWAYQISSRVRMIK